ncbi:MAG: diphthamide synthesis protein [Candidatus Altiarchaeota archaeon]|nr:diphthamide synthesis protein [Candidatus Altiarchaeota archaeon]
MKKLFIPAYLRKNPLPAVEKALSLIQGYERIGLLTTSQHLNQLDSVSEFLEKKGKKALIGGQILGCDIENAAKIEEQVDCFLYIGSGRFHPLGVALKTDKPVVVSNPYSDSANMITEDEKQKYLKKRKGRLLKALQAEVFGVIVSTKSGQFSLEKALRIKERLEDRGKKAFIFAGSEINPGNLLPFKVDAWINTACPRLVDDHFSKPILNPEELDTLEELLRGT